MNDQSVDWIGAYFVLRITCSYVLRNTEYVILNMFFTQLSSIAVRCEVSFILSKV